ncbi:MAG: acyloxyacyl hydrolase [Candidatus Omnitrophota bacterium]|jgi:opacity protein-like surface antigen
MMRLFLCFVVTLFCFCFRVSIPLHAEESAPLEELSSPKHQLDEIGVFLGYGDSTVTDKDKYRVMPLAVQLGVSCDKYGLGFSDWFERGIRTFFHKDFRPAGLTTFIFEPFLSTVVSPDNNMEAGMNLLLRYAWPVTKRIRPYCFGGGGVMFITQHLREQSTQYNFTPQTGAGIAFLVTEKTALSVEYRYRHFSNADLKEPNEGVNIDMFFFGITRVF